MTRRGRGRGKVVPGLSCPLGQAPQSTALGPTAPSTTPDANTPSHELAVGNAAPGLHYQMKTAQTQGGPSLARSLLNPTPGAEQGHTGAQGGSRWPQSRSPQGPDEESASVSAGEERAQVQGSSCPVPLSPCSPTPQGPVHLSPGSTLGWIIQTSSQV